MASSMMDALKFDNSENTCASLRIIAELVRRGELEVIMGQFEETATRGQYFTRKLEVSLLGRRDR